MNPAEPPPMPENLVHAAESQGHHMWLTIVLPAVIWQAQHMWSLTIGPPRGRSRPDRHPWSRAPRPAATAIPAVKTSAAQIAAPRSCGGLTGQTHGVVQRASNAYSLATT
jgi:hypothetical protein